MEIVKFVVPILIVVTVYLIVRRFTSKYPMRMELQAARLLILAGAAGFFAYKFLLAEKPIDNFTSLAMTMIFFGSAVVLLKRHFTAKV